LVTGPDVTGTPFTMATAVRPVSTPAGVVSRGCGVAAGRGVGTGAAAVALERSKAVGKPTSSVGAVAGVWLKPPIVTGSPIAVAASIAASSGLKTV
jgi:hypothetical protein